MAIHSPVLCPPLRQSDHSPSPLTLLPGHEKKGFHAYIVPRLAVNIISYWAGEALALAALLTGRTVRAGWLAVLDSTVVVFTCQFCSFLNTTVRRITGRGFDIVTTRVFCAVRSIEQCFAEVQCDRVPWTRPMNDKWYTSIQPKPRTQPRYNLYVPLSCSLVPSYTPTCHYSYLNSTHDTPTTKTLTIKGFM